MPPGPTAGGTWARFSLDDRAAGWRDRRPPSRRGDELLDHIEPAPCGSASCSVRMTLHHHAVSSSRANRPVLARSGSQRLRASTPGRSPGTARRARLRPGPRSLPGHAPQHRGAPGRSRRRSCSTARAASYVLHSWRRRRASPAAKGNRIIRTVKKGSSPRTSRSRRSLPTRRRAPRTPRSPPSPCRLRHEAHAGQPSSWRT